MYTEGMQGFLAKHGVLNKDYREWMVEQSTALEKAADYVSQEHCGCPVTYIASCNTDKEELVQAQRQRLNVAQGLIGVWACVEACRTYRSTFDPTAKKPALLSVPGRCKHLYFYYDHIDVGLMSIRLQTWAPYGIQVALNGREWLRRSLEKEQSGYQAHGNKFWRLEDFAVAQQLLDRQLDTRWDQLLAGFVPQVFPTMAHLFGERMAYYWTLWQSEWATDYLCESPQVVTALTEKLLRYAVITGTSPRVLRYLGLPVDKKKGGPHPLSRPELFTKAQDWYDGSRVRHWVDHNSVKFYNEQNVFRVEMTMNNPEKFRVYRHKTGQAPTEPKTRLPLRKGIADIAIRAQLSGQVNRNLTEHLATLQDTTPVGEMLQEVVQPRPASRRMARALDVMGKDRELLQAIADPAYAVSGLTNKALQQQLGGTAWAKGMTGSRLSARISRNLRLLREHGLIRKEPNQRRYRLTDKGRKLTTALNVIWAASTEQLLEKAA
jgi:DNA-binding HxlR family transcriptional regulator